MDNAPLIPAEQVLRPPDLLEKPQNDPLQQSWDRKSVSPHDRFYLDNMWKVQSMPNLQTPVLHAPFSTFGMVMPLPFLWSATERFYPVDVSRLTFQTDGVDNYILRSAVARCHQLINSRTGLSPYAQHWSHQESQLYQLSLAWLSERSAAGSSSGSAGAAREYSERFRLPWLDSNAQWIYRLFGSSPSHSDVTSPLSSIRIHVKAAGDDWPSSRMDESYGIVVDKEHIYIVANETWGALRALESLTQLMWRTADRSQVFINQTYIFDKPRFVHRGLLIDTSRHYISKSILLINLEAMSYNKMNVFHWHIVDDNSFPLQSEAFPELSKKGAFRSSQIYTYSDIREVVEFARLRGIRVLPEYDIPGHTRSLAYSKPELLAQCRDNDDKTVYFGPLNTYSNETYDFLKEMFDELIALFPDEYLHLGGDEVETVCWDADPEMITIREKLGIAPSLVNEYFWRRVQNIFTELGSRNPAHQRKLILWEDVFSRMLEIKTSLIMHLWKPASLPDTAFKGDIIYSSCWYLDHLTDNRNWDSFYLCEPLDKLGLRLDDTYSPVIGGEACMWSEFQSDDTILARIWPVTSGVAERLWSPREVNNMLTVGPRIEEQRCRAISRGIPQAVLLGPGSCEFNGAVSSFEESVQLKQCTNAKADEFIQSDAKDLILRTNWLFYFSVGVLLGSASMFLCTSHGHLISAYRKWVFSNHLRRRVSLVRLLSLVLMIIFATLFLVMRSQSDISFTS